MPRVSLPLLVTTINKKDSGVPNPDIEEVRDEQGDTLGGTCKTDGDHMLGGKYNCAWALWNTHHTVNRQFHHVRERDNLWLHSYAPDEVYGEERDYPSFWNALPPSLTSRAFE
jgi:hypothetical protein